LVLLCLVFAASVQAAVYTNIKDITVRELSNGVQLIVKADGVLDVNVVHANDPRPRGRIRIKFPNARNASGKNTFYLNTYPISVAQLSVLPNAVEGVGLMLDISLIQPSTFSVRQSDDMTSVVVTVNSNRTLEGTDGGKQATGQAGSKLQVEADPDGLLTITAQKASFSEVIREIGEKAGVDIVVNDASSLQNLKLSINVEGATADEALKAIAAATGLALSNPDDTNGVYMFSQGIPVDLASYRLSDTASFPMQQVLAANAPKLLPNFLLQYLHVNNAQNAVVVTAPRQMLNKIGQDLEKVDIAPPVLMIEAFVVEFKNTKTKDSFLSMIYHSGQRFWTTSPDTGFMYYTDIGILPHNFEADLHALADKGAAHILANPRMVVLNGFTANIFTGKIRFIEVEFMRWGTLIKQIQGVNVGVSLNITPWTGGNGEITTRIEPQVSNIAELDSTTGLPTLSTRQLSTSVRVKDGETIILGGLKQEQTTKRVSRIPVLSDLPILGKAFTRHYENTVDSELVIFITPHLLNPDTCQLTDDPREKQWREQFLPDHDSSTPK